MDPKNDWKKFRRLKFDTKSLNKRIKKAETVSTKHAHRFVLKRLASIRDARRHIISWLLLTGFLIVATAIQLVWFQNSYRTTAVAAGGTYSEGMVGQIKTLNPLYAQSQAEQSASRLVFSSLYNYDETGHLRPDIARSITRDKTGKKYTVVIRDDAKWHDGQNLTADDVVFTVGLMQNPAVRSYLFSVWTSVSVKKVDTNTVEFTLPTSFASFPHILNFSILPKHSLDTVEPSSLRENTFSVSPIGSGPFELRLLQNLGNDDDKKVVYLSRWNDYYKGRTKLDRFEIHTYKDQADVASAFRSKDINAAIDTNFSDKQFAEMTRSQPTQSAVYALLNNDSPILKDAKVRQALQLSANTAKVRSQLPYVTRSYDLPFSRRQVETATLPSVAPFNQVAAAKLLDQAGWKVDPTTNIRMNKKQPLQLHLVWGKSDDYSRVAKELGDEWKKLGIVVDEQEFDASKTDQNFAQAVLQPRAYDILINELAIGADADVFPYWHSSQAENGGFNFSNYRSRLSDDALLSAKLRPEKQLRDQKYKVFAQQWVKDVPAIGLYQSALVYTQSPRITSFTNSAILPTAVDRYANILDWTTESAEVYKTP